VTYGTLTLKRGMTQNQDIWIWFVAVADGRRRNARASGVIRQYSRSGSVVDVSYELHGCLPIKVKAPSMNAKDGIIAIEELQIAYTTMSVKAGS
jgi:phage tail-like protein